MNASAPLPPQTVLTWKASVWWKSALRNPFRDLLRGLILFWCLGSLSLSLSQSVCVCVCMCPSRVCFYSMCRDARARGIKGCIQWISCMHVCGRECNRIGVSESEEERLIGVFSIMQRQRCKGGGNNFIG